MSEARKAVAARIKYLGRSPSKIVELPIPFVSRSEKIGEVLCNPIGTFPIEHAEKLLEISGEDGLFKLVEYIYDESKAEKELETVEKPKTDQLMRADWRKLLDGEWNSRSAAEYNSRKNAAPFTSYKDESTGKWKLKPKNSAVTVSVG